MATDCCGISLAIPPIQYFRPATFLQQQQSVWGGGTVYSDTSFGMDPLLQDYEQWLGLESQCITDVPPRTNLCMLVFDIAQTALSLSLTFPRWIFFYWLFLRKKKKEFDFSCMIRYPPDNFCPPLSVHCWMCRSGVSSPRKRTIVDLFDGCRNIRQSNEKKWSFFVGVSTLVGRSGKAEAKIPGQQ